MTAPTQAQIDIKEIEAEANEFAMSLLMPTEWLMRDVANINLADDTQIEKLAKKYRVSVGIIAFRIGQLGLKA